MNDEPLLRRIKARGLNAKNPMKEEPFDFAQGKKVGSRN